MAGNSNSEIAPASPSGAPEAFFERGFGWLAKLGGLALLAAAFSTVVSVLGRYFFSKPIPGDIEVAGFLVAAGISLFLPYCTLRKGHVIVDVFTERAPPGIRRLLDILGHLALAMIAGILAWRMALGGIDLRSAGEETMVLRWPIWWGFVVTVPCFALMVLAALLAAFREKTP